jgi:hypothetical protein
MMDSTKSTMGEIKVKRARSKKIEAIVHAPIEQPVVEQPVVEQPVVEEPTVKTIKIRKPRKKKGEPMALVDSSDDSPDEAKTQSGSGSDESPKKKQSNNWIDHVKSFREANPSVSYKDALKQAKETYKK